MENQHGLQKTLTPVHLWAIAVGMVISGQYFGWNYGFGEAGVLGMTVASLLVVVFFTCFIFSFAELSTSIPSAGGPTAYARRAMGPFAGFMTGIACLMEFVFAPPAIAVSTGAYVNFLIPAIPAVYVTIGVFVLFILVNLIGMKGAALIELIATIAALVGLALYFGAGLPHIEWSNLVNEQAFSNGMGGIMAAIPYGIWFFLAIEGGAMAAEEVRNPRRDIPKGFIAGILTLGIATVLNLLVTAGLGGGQGALADYPLPQALSSVYGDGNIISAAVAIIGLFGLIASLHGIIIGYSRQTYALARDGYFPAFLSKLNKKGAPVWALILPGVIGVICAGSSGFANALILLAVFGAVLMYCLSMLSLFILRAKEPAMSRPFKVSYPLVPVIALVLGLLFLYCVVRYSLVRESLPLFGAAIPLWLVVLVILGASVAYYGLVLRTRFSKEAQNVSATHPLVDTETGTI